MIVLLILGPPLTLFAWLWISTHDIWLDNSEEYMNQ